MSDRICYNICCKSTVVISLWYRVECWKAVMTRELFITSSSTADMTYCSFQWNPCSRPWEGDILVSLHIRVLFIYKLCYWNIGQFCYFHKPLNIENTQFGGGLVDDIYALHMASSVRIMNVFPLGVCGTANINILCHTLIKSVCIFIFLNINFAFLTAYGSNLLLEQFQPVAS